MTGILTLERSGREATLPSSVAPRALCWSMIVISDRRCLDYVRPGHPESPARVARTLDLLETQGDISIDWREPFLATDAPIVRVHSPEHLTSLSGGVDFDADTPALPGISEHARRSVGGALLAMNCALDGHPAFSLLRPPGHHATPERAMGFCYLNQVAIAAMEARANGLRVAVFDFDVHHGNGTEEILHGKTDVLYVSVHQSPCYPGTGRSSRGNCRNFPMAPELPRDEYRDALSMAWDDVVQFRPDLVAVSAGFDAYRGDPLAQELLEGEDFESLGRDLRSLAVPTFAVLEGGYSTDLPDLVLGFLRGWEG